MYLKELKIKNFRLFEEKIVTFSEGTNSIVGPNAQGKTTIVEALYLLMTGRSFRAKSFLDMVQKGKSSFFIEVKFLKDEIEQTLSLSWQPQEKKIFHNKTRCQVKELLSCLHGVLLTPDHLQLIKGGPLLRRQYLDWQLAQCDPLYLNHFQRYKRALMHKSALLKSRSQETLSIWNQQIALSGAYINEKRHCLVQWLNPLFGAVYQELTQEKSDVQLSYNTDFLTEDALLYKITALEKEERRLKTTLVGPHREDVAIHLNQHPVKEYASEGQKSALVMALKLAEWELLKDKLKLTPLLLIDDVGLALDRVRKERLYEKLTALGQTLLTMTEAPPKFSSVIKIILN